MVGTAVNLGITDHGLDRATGMIDPTNSNVGNPLGRQGIWCWRWQFVMKEYTTSSPMGYHPQCPTRGSASSHSSTHLQPRSYPNPWSKTYIVIVAPLCAHRAWATAAPAMRHPTRLFFSGKLVMGKLDCFLCLWLFFARAPSSCLFHLGGAAWN